MFRKVNNWSELKFHGYHLILLWALNSKITLAVNLSIMILNCLEDVWYMARPWMNPDFKVKLIWSVCTVYSLHLANDIAITVALERMNFPNFKAIPIIKIIYSLKGFRLLLIENS